MIASSDSLGQTKRDWPIIASSDSLGGVDSSKMLTERN
jgi:hypothetical protein